MFGLFKSSSPKVKVVDKVWMYSQGKLNACVEMHRLNPQCLFVTWFENTKQQIIQALGLTLGSGTVVLADSLTPEAVQNRMVIFVEHYPLSKVEQDLFLTLKLNEVPVLSSLDGPFFEQFKGNNIIELMKKMGMNEDEAIGHSMITKSIERAQQKIAERCMVEHKATSQQEWFSLNIQNKK